jgi:Bacterial SH3 domain.
MKKLTISIFMMLLAFSLNAQDNRVNTLQGLESGQSQNQDTKLTAIVNKATRLFGAKDDLTSVIMIVPAGDTVDVIGSDSTFFHIIYQESEGYIFKRHATVQKITNDVESAVQQQANVREEQPVRQQQISRFSYLENKYGTSMAARLISGKIWKGMTTEMVQDSWGGPKKINRVINGNVVKEDWFYNNSWLYFENDTLTEWGPVK